MRGSRIARRYARALLELAGRDQAAQWGLELERLARSVDSPELIERLCSPQLAAPVRLEAMAKIAERLELSFPLRSFAVMVARHGRVRHLGAMAEAYQDLFDQMLSRTRATLTFAREPDQDAVQSVLAVLSKVVRKEIIPTFKVDAGLLGGVVVEIDGKIYDGSLQGRLVEAERQLAG